MNLYVKYTIDVLKRNVSIELLNQIFKATYNITGSIIQGSRDQQYL